MRKLLSLLLSVFLVLLAITLFFTAQLELEEGKKVGSGIFYLKGHYVEEMMVKGEKKRAIVYEQGPGVFTIPFLLSILLTGLYTVGNKYFKKRLS